MMRRIKLSKGPVPPARLPTREEKTRGPVLSELAQYFRDASAAELRTMMRLRRMYRKGSKLAPGSDLRDLFQVESF